MKIPTTRSVPKRRGPTSVVTAMTLPISVQQAWEGLMFFEQIPGPPPLHLRLLLPRPLGSEGSSSVVGDETRCLYAGGHLLKAPLPGGEVIGFRYLPGYAFEQCAITDPGEVAPPY